ISASAVMLLAYAAGALMLGVEWPLLWLNAAQAFAERDMAANGHQMVSLPSVLAAAWPAYPAEMELLGYALSAAGIACLMEKLYMTRDSAKALRLLVCVLGPAVVFFSPHTLFYDVGLCLLPWALILGNTDSQ